LKVLALGCPSHRSCTPNIVLTILIIHTRHANRRTVSSGSKKVMCTQCGDELSVNEAFKFIQQYSENVTTDNLLSLQRDMVELNFLLKSAKRRSVGSMAATTLPHSTLSAQCTAPFTDTSNGLDQSRR